MASGPRCCCRRFARGVGWANWKWDAPAPLRRIGGNEVGSQRGSRLPGCPGPRLVWLAGRTNPCFSGAGLEQVQFSRRVIGGEVSIGIGRINSSLIVADRIVGETVDRGVGFADDGETSGCSVIGRAGSEQLNGLNEAIPVGVGQDLRHGLFLFDHVQRFPKVAQAV